jgi:short subunit dehydrogenase-like uncharacterized protein
MEDNGGRNENKQSDAWLLYGANGYTGRLIATEACSRGLRPILAGRDATAIESLAGELGCDHRIFDLTSSERICNALDGISAVMHCAGPYSRTARPMAEACIAAGAHYMDITGEIPVLEDLFTLDDMARSAGIAMVPGSGFDVVPTDCLALALKEALPDATRLRLAMAGKPTLSPGTWRTTLETVPRGGAIRRDGRLLAVPHAWHAEDIRFDDGVRHAMTLPWGDVSTAWRSTRIPDIAVYAAMTKATVRSMRLARSAARSLLSVPRLLRAVQGVASHAVKGPSLKHRETEFMRLRGDVWNDRGEHVTRFMRTPEGYTSTVVASIPILQALLDGRIPSGVWTPAQAMGSGYAATLPGMRWIDGAA